MAFLTKVTTYIFYSFFVWVIGHKFRYTTKDFFFPHSRWRYSPGWALASATICLQVSQFLALSLHSFIPSFSGPWSRHPAILFLVFLFVLLHTALRTASFFGIAVYYSLSIRVCASHRILWHLINLTIFSPLIMASNSSFCRAAAPQLVKKFPALMEPEGLLLYSQGSATYSYPKPNWPSLGKYISLKSTLILYSYMRPGLQFASVLQESSPNLSIYSLLSPHSTCPAHLILPGFIIWIMFGEEYD